MARRKVKIEKIKELLKDKKYVLGTERTIKLAKLGKIKTIVLARDLDEERKEKIKEIAKIANIEIIESEKTRKEIAEEIKKPFNIGCIGVECK